MISHSDFELIAHFYPGLTRASLGRGFALPWEIRIFADGRVEEEIIQSEEEKNEIKLAKIDQSLLKEIIAAVESNRFMELKDRIEYHVTDCSTLSLRIILDGKEREVSVYAPEYLKNNEHVKRFLAIWDCVLRVVSPLIEQAERSRQAAILNTKNN